MDWRQWHEQYEDVDSPLARRLKNVQGRIRDVLDRLPPGPLSIVSLCAGQGRDLLGVLADHPRRGDVQARLVELDPGLAGTAARAARSAGLDGVEVITGDAALTDHYRGFVPADLVLLCGIFGNVTDQDIKATIAYSPQLCRPGGFVIWTRHRKAPDRVPMICEAFAGAGFELDRLTEPGILQSVGVHRFTGSSQPLEAGATMFSFAGYDVLRRAAPGPATSPDGR